MYNFVEQIYLDEEKCIGCNKCISNCPITSANIAYTFNGNNKIKVNSEKCIHCGECIKVCDHNARTFKDDTERFFKDLLNGKKISVIAAPSTLVNFHEYKRLLGFLKSLGVTSAYDVSFGADITVWAYLRTIKKNNMNTLIAQPCPPIVNYIEKYQPELIEKLAPIQSPMMCTAIYMKKYANLQEDIAFLSPCIGKADEINDNNTFGYVKYNITFRRLSEYIQANNIDITVYEEAGFDDMGCSLGVLFSRPGGLKENIEVHIKDSWIRQIHGPEHVYKYLEDYNKNLKTYSIMPLVVDILNCSNGCNFGTGTCNNSISSTTLDQIDYKLNKLKNMKKTDKGGKLFRKKINWLHDYFDKNLKLEDFKRSYNKNIIVSDTKEPSQKQYDEIFIKMNKLTEESRNINCSACGYGSCRIMARSIFNCLNVASNCIDYNKKEVINEHHLLELRNEFFTNISHELRTPLNVIYSVLQLKMNYIDSLTQDDILKYNQIIKQNCLRLIRLINNIIDLSRIEAGFFKPIFNIENIVEVVESTTLSISAYAQNKNMNLVFDTEIEELFVNCDVNLIERIMLNLLSNSVKYGKEKGNIEVNIFNSDSKNMTISVKDDGIGIPDHMLKKIFERFQKVDTSLSRKNEGSGIGLSIVKSLVEIQGGTIKCNSQLGIGTEMIITFPLADHQFIQVEKHVVYEKNNTEIVDIEFSDIYT